MGKKVDDNNAKCYSGRFTVIIEQRKKLQKIKERLLFGRREQISLRTGSLKLHKVLRQNNAIYLDIFRLLIIQSIFPSIARNYNYHSKH